MNHDYDNIARFYDWAAGWTLAPARRELGRLARDSGAEKIVDFGCGTGLQLAELARLGIHALGLDNSPAMLEVARKRVEALPEAQRRNLRLESGPDFAVQGQGERFDLAIISLVLHESADDRFEILDAAFRLAPKVFILDWGMPERNLDYPMHGVVRCIERLAGKRHYSSYKEYMRLGALEGLMQRYLQQRASKGFAVAQISERRQMVMNTILFMQVELE